MTSPNERRRLSELGTTENPIIDSAMTLEQALAQNPEFPCPQEILDRQGLLSVVYYSFDDKFHKGQLVMDKELLGDMSDVFAALAAEKFPVTSVIPIAHPKFQWNDELSMQANNSSGFNYRTVARTNRISNHGFGFAFDFNPKLNPYIRGDFVQPAGAAYRPGMPGVITADSLVTRMLKARGWEWGGNWDPRDRVDYQHFAKPLRR